MSGLKTDPQQRIEANPIVPTPIPAKHEFVEIGLQIALTEAVVDAETIALEVGKDSVNPGHEDVRRHLADHDGSVLSVGNVSVGLVPVRPNHASLGRDVGDKRVERLAAIVADGSKPDASGRLTVIQFDRPDDRHLADGATTLTTSDRFVAGAERNGALVNLDDACKGIALGIDHRLAQSMKQEPRALVGADAELGLKLESGNAVGVRSDQVSREKPSAER